MRKGSKKPRKKGFFFLEGKKTSFDEFMELSDACAMVLSPQFSQMMPQILLHLGGGGLRGGGAYVLGVFAYVLRVVDVERKEQWETVQTQLFGANATPLTAQQGGKLVHLLMRQWFKICAPTSFENLILFEQIPAHPSRATTYVALHNLCGTNSHLKMAVGVAGGTIKAWHADRHEMEVMLVDNGDDLTSGSDLIASFWTQFRHAWKEARLVSPRQHYLPPLDCVLELMRVHVDPFWRDE